jgi:hypothetical protein
MQRQILLISVPLLLLVGCASVSTPVSETSEPPSAVPSESSQTYAPSDFRAVADKSCERALEFGVSEIEQGLAGFEQVLVPKDEGYEGYSAAYFQPEDTYELIYETDWFAVCSASNTYALSEEAGAESGISVEYLVDQGVFETTQDFGEFGISVVRYSMVDGYFNEVTFVEAGESGVVSISYGPLSEDQKQIIKTAVERFFAE